MAVQGMRPLYVAAILTWVAGFVDAVGFLSLGKIYTANMSGNSIAIGIEGIRQNWPELLARLWPVAMYVAGLLFCRLLVEFGARKKVSRIATVTIAIEMLLLLPPLVISGADFHVSQPQQVLYVALLALAMGMQNAALTHFSNLTLNTGFVTGTLVKAAEQSAKYLTWLYDELRRRPTLKAILESRQQESFREAYILLGMWVVYVTGAACGTLAFFSFAVRALIAALAALLSVIGLDMKHPLALQEEKQQLAPAS